MADAGSTFELRVAPDLGFVIADWPDALGELLRTFFAHYLKPNRRTEAARLLRLTVVPSLDDSPHDAQLVLDLPALELRHREQEILLRCSGFSASCDTAGGTARIALYSPTREDSELFVTTILPAIMAELARRSGWQLIHAAAIARFGVGILLPGPSGCGKTTIARDAAEHGFNVVSDDLVWLVADAPRARLVAFPRGAPIVDAPPTSSDEATLAAVVRPSISATETSHIISCSTTDILPELLAQAGLPIVTESSGKGFADIVRASASVPCYRLAAGRQRSTTIRLLEGLLQESHSGLGID